MELEKDCWYWMANPNEGDIWYPIYINGAGAIFIDGVEQTFKIETTGVILRKAIMPV